MKLPEIVRRYERTGHLPVIYVSGPMSGLPDANFPAFNETARKLRLLGFPVLNPADFGHGDPPWAGDMDWNIDPRLVRVEHEEWTRCLARDLPLVAAADVVVLLRGYEASRGACLELDAALAFGKHLVVAGEGSLGRFVEHFLGPDEFDRTCRADRLAEKVRELAYRGVVIDLLIPIDDDDDDDGPETDPTPETIPDPDPRPPVADACTVGVGDLDDAA